MDGMVASVTLLFIYFRQQKSIVYGALKYRVYFNFGLKKNTLADLHLTHSLRDKNTVNKRS